jgi:glycosyltransferase involved in cell wall biosynthesis
MTEKTRILQLIDGLSIGGAEVLLRDLCSGLLQRGYEVEVGFSTPGPILNDLKILGIKAVHLPKLARIDPFRYGSGLIRLIKNFRPHLVHTHLFKSDFHGRTAAYLCKTPVIISTLHNNDPWAQHWLFGPLYGFSARRATCLIAVSKQVKEYHARYSRIPLDKMVTISNGVDVDRFRFNPSAGMQVRADLGLKETDPVIGIIGRLKPQKDHATFLSAAAQIAGKFPDTHFLIVGDGPLRKELEDQANALQISGSVLFCGVRSDIPAILSALDILVLSSRWEGLPVNLLEGMAAGRAIVSTEVSGVRDVVTPEKTAVLVEPGNASAIANACIALLADPARRQMLGENAAQCVREKFSLEAMIDQTVLVYETALNQCGLRKAENQLGAP